MSIATEIWLGVGVPLGAGKVDGVGRWVHVYGAEVRACLTDVAVVGEQGGGY